ncbi:hypothetical protein SAMN05216196_104161 [Lutimaribacter pacificus]|uniref:Secreted protein n=1 Tax=Lutimaribacter pacificus TaxID=391948 RepID=A0A1H0HYT0_9RHOB|nr:hypothetical protein [Lutimaribacter pacificus]SDO24309.1 hypothetical protein SAMN05216196_104161 [Lutimaribacter pacificus]SHK29328.1 hypothetical protein SAMN05444142_104224 [Lutimaribacter pacificus]
MRRLALPLALLATSPGIAPARADSPRIVSAEASRNGMGWRFDVTISHPDTGWDHYADGWEVTTPEGERLGMRKLHHPHVGEQPFTRSLSNVMVPDGLREVRIRARCSVDGWSDTAVTVTLSPGG